MKFLMIFSVFSALLFADNFIQTTPKTPDMKVSPLTPEDKSFKTELSKYPKGTAFFIDGKTGRIIKTTKQALPSYKQQTKKPKPATKPKKIPYEMQEERIQLM
ncbi:MULTISPECIES: hypothetical protein [Helicobacter]|uniref:Periplasmic protein n=1 Tax=Helicobacter ibis TaxID=2962633 RepID=A0ABT4VD21_9HELI|nr:MULTISPECIES: hypothetical protein [Helicobacter]MDA3967328.1 hypothetical protein [Helicobacter sp. WB40]MDA3968603.1 hypothetical protein [Helicobacter ibis]